MLKTSVAREMIRRRDVFIGSASWRVTTHHGERADDDSEDDDNVFSFFR